MGKHESRHTDIEKKRKKTDIQTDTLRARKEGRDESKKKALLR